MSHHRPPQGHPQGNPVHPWEPEAQRGELTPAGLQSTLLRQAQSGPRAPPPVTALLPHGAVSVDREQTGQGNGWDTGDCGGLGAWGPAVRTVACPPGGHGWRDPGVKREEAGPGGGLSGGRWPVQGLGLQRECAVPHGDDGVQTEAGVGESSTHYTRLIALLPTPGSQGPRPPPSAALTRSRGSLSRPQVSALSLCVLLGLAPGRQGPGQPSAGPPPRAARGQAGAPWGPQTNRQPQGPQEANRGSA